MNSYFVQDNLSLVIITGFILNALILYVIINAATKASLAINLKKSKFTLKKLK